MSHPLTVFQKYIYCLFKFDINNSLTCDLLTMDIHTLLYPSEPERKAPELIHKWHPRE